MPSGTFSTGGKPPLIRDNRLNYEVGLFQDTLFLALIRFKFDNKSVIHLDADIYSSTLFVLTTLASKLKKGDILIFDEFADCINEFRAFNDFISAFYFKYKLIAEVNNYNQIAIKLI